jgi:hypothetical protein
MTLNEQFPGCDDRKPSIGQIVDLTFSGSAKIVRVGEQDRPIGGDPAYWNRASFDADVQLHDGSVWHTKVWWTGSRHVGHSTGPNFYRVR